MAKRQELRTEKDFEKRDWGLEFCPYFESFHIIGELVGELEKAASPYDQLHLMHRYSRLIVNEIMSLEKEKI
jgi:hypothetical protein